VTNSAVHISAV